MKKLLFTVSLLSFSCILINAQDAALLAAEKARGIMTGYTGVQ